MFKRTMIATSLAVAALASAHSMAAVVGGGATLPQNLYGTTTGSGILASANPGFNAYVGVGSGGGKQAFFGNDATRLQLAAGTTVDYAGSDSLVSAAELNAYNAHATLGRSSFGPLIQIPSVATSVTVPWHLDGQTALNLTSTQLADIFAGVITRWNQLSFNGSAGPDLPITVIYRTETSGTTEIFTTHLRAVKPQSVPGASNNFSTAVGFNPAVNPPAGSTYSGVTGSDGVAAAIAATNGSIGYVSPDFADYDNAQAVVAINGLLPTEVNVQATLDTVLPPTQDASKNVANPLDWVPTFANPSAGYPIVGYTNLVFSQCYADTADNGRIRNFINRHYTGVNDTVVTSHSFIPLSSAWRQAVHETFFSTASALRVGNADVCNGMGRPL